MKKNIRKAKRRVSGSYMDVLLRILASFLKPKDIVDFIRRQFADKVAGPVWWVLSKFLLPLVRKAKDMLFVELKHASQRRKTKKNIKRLDSDDPKEREDAMAELGYSDNFDD